MDRFRICLLGGFETWVGVHPITLQLPKKTAGLLAYLATRPNQACSRDRLADLLWGDGAPEQARHSLRQALLMLRRSLAEISPALVRAEGQMLSLEAAEVDVAAFARRVSEGSAGSLEEAAALYRGEFLEDLHVNEVAFQDWVGGERERLRELAVEALARLLQHQRRSSAVEPAIQTALRLLRLDRTQEVVHRTLIRLYTRQGRRAEALRQYHACVGVLRGELGVEPEPETVRLRRELLQPAARRFADRRPRLEKTREVPDAGGRPGPLSAAPARPSVAPHAGEPRAVADLAVGLADFAARVPVGERRRVRRRLEDGVPRVTEGAAGGRLDARVADEAVRHPGQVRGGDVVGLRDPAVAGPAAVRARELRPHRGAVAEIGASVDGGGENGR